MILQFLFLFFSALNYPQFNYRLRAMTQDRISKDEYHHQNWKLKRSFQELVDSKQDSLLLNYPQLNLILRFLTHLAIYDRHLFDWKRGQHLVTLTH